VAKHIGKRGSSVWDQVEEAFFVAKPDQLVSSPSQNLGPFGEGSEALAEVCR
jgi:hypothetical protein